MKERPPILNYSPPPRRWWQHPLLGLFVRFHAWALTIIGALFVVFGVLSLMGVDTADMRMWGRPVVTFEDKVAWTLSTAAITAVGVFLFYARRRWWRE